MIYTPVQLFAPYPHYCYHVYFNSIEGCFWYNFVTSDGKLASFSEEDILKYFVEDICIGGMVK